MRFFLASGPVARHGQNGHDGERHGQMEQVQSDTKAGQDEGDADAEKGPRPRQEQQQGVIDGGEEEIREGEGEPEQRGGEPGVQRQRRQEEIRRRLARSYRLKTWKPTAQRLVKAAQINQFSCECVSFTVFFHTLFSIYH